MKLWTPTALVGLPLVGVAAVLVSDVVPAWAPEAALAFLAWLGLETVRQGRALKRVPTRDEIEAAKADASAEHRRIFEGLDALNRKVADNQARIEALVQRMDAHRSELDDLSAQERLLGTQLADSHTDALATARALFDRLDERLRPLERRRPR